MQILGQLKNFGANRLVTKTEWMLRWPDQPSYLKIRKVIPEMDRVSLLYLGDEYFGSHIVYITYIYSLNVLVALARQSLGRLDI